MTEAWQKRAGQQQEFIEGVMRWAREQDAGGSVIFFMGLSIELAGTFVSRKLTECGEPVPEYLRLSTGDQMLASYSTKIAASIRKFQRTEEEGQKLLAQILLKFVEAGTSEARQRYLHQEVHEPEKLYNGHRTMDKVGF